jgi:hypothetical protein
MQTGSANIRVVLISGRKQSGKDTAAKEFIKRGYCKIAFAKVLKEMSATIVSKLLGKKIKAKDFEKSEFKNARIDSNLFPNIKGIRNRAFLQLFGTEFMRKHIHPDIWVYLTVHAIEKAWVKGNRTKFVITDCRYPNEIEVFTEELKKYFKNAEVTTLRITRDHKMVYQLLLDKFREHSSETALDFYKFDHWISNTGTLKGFISKVRSFSVQLDSSFRVLPYWCN